MRGPTRGVTGSGITQADLGEAGLLCSHNPGGGLFSAPSCPGSIVSAAAFHFRVRDGNGWFHRALTTRTTYYRGSACEPQAPRRPWAPRGDARVAGAGSGSLCGSLAAVAWLPSAVTRHLAAVCRHPSAPVYRHLTATYRAGDAETGGAGAPPDHCFGSGRGIRTPDLRVMSPMSYRCSIPRRRAASIARAAVRPVAPLGAIPAPAHGRAHERHCYKVEVRRRGITDVPDEGSSPRPLVPLSYTHCCASTCGLSSG